MASPTGRGARRFSSVRRIRSAWLRSAPFTLDPGSTRRTVSAPSAPVSGSVSTVTPSRSARTITAASGVQSMVTAKRWRRSRSGSPRSSSRPGLPGSPRSSAIRPVALLRSCSSSSTPGASRIRPSPRVVAAPSSTSPRPRASSSAARRARSRHQPTSAGSDAPDSTSSSNRMNAPTGMTARENRMP